ncbi:MAG: hypothetical protein QM664_04230 [Flavihumibacter sp.]
MVTTEISGIDESCASWQNMLREQRTHFGALKEQLLQISAHQHNPENLREIEHFQNQFYIQLINIHDLKHAIREHMQVIGWERRQQGQVTDATVAAHDELHSQVLYLQHTLAQVDKEFGAFAASLQ